LKAEVALAVEEQILDMLVGKHAAADSRASFRGLLRQKAIEMRPVTIEVPVMEKGLGGNLSDPKLATGMDLTEMIHRVAKGLHPNPSPNPNHPSPNPNPNPNPNAKA
jgi:hypothetical protein